MDIKGAVKIVTFVIIPLIIFGILLFDVYAILVGGTESSISSLIIVSAYKMPFMVFIIGFFNGVLVGHLFWRMKPNKDTKEIDQ